MGRCAPSSPPRKLPNNARDLNIMFKDSDDAFEAAEISDKERRGLMGLTETAVTRSGTTFSQPADEEEEREAEAWGEIHGIVKQVYK